VSKRRAFRGSKQSRRAGCAGFWSLPSQLLIWSLSVPKGLGIYDAGSCPSEGIKNSIPESGVGPKSPVNQRGREFGTADLSIKETVAARRAVRIACRP
jgi:hypothetical protein